MSDEVSKPGREVAALFGRGSVYTVATVLQGSMGILVVPAVTRLLSESSYGKVATALVILQVLTYLVTVGLPYVITIEFFDRRGGLSAAQNLLVISVALSLTITAVVDVLGPWWSERLLNEARYDAPLRLAVWSAVPTALLLAVQALLRSQNRVKGFLAVTAVGTAGAQLLGLALVNAVRTPASYIGGVGAGVALAGLLGLKLTGIGFARLRERRLLLAAVELGVPTVPHALAIYLVSAGDRVVIQRELGFEAVARYHIAYLVGALGVILVSALNNAWAPIIYGASEERRWSVLADTTASVFRMMGVVTAGVALGAPLALSVLAPGAYEPAELTSVSTVVALSTLAYVGYIANAHAIFYRRRAWSLARASIVSAVVNLALNLVLIPPLGLIGSAYATVAAYGVQRLQAERIRRRVVAVPWHGDAERRAWGMGLGAASISLLVPSTGPWLGVRAVVAGLLVLVFAYRVRGLTDRSPK